MNTLAVVTLALSLAQPAPVPGGTRPADTLAKADVNTVWTIPELHKSWVESLLAVRKPGGGLYTIDGNIVQRDLGRSIKDAVTFLRTHPDRCPGFADGWRRYDLYFSWPDTDQPRGGPSAGLAFAVAAYAAILDLKVRTDVAFTGAIDADGKVRRIGGLPLKIPACRQAGMRTFVLPAADQVDYRELDDELCEELRLVAIDNADEAFFEAFGSDGPQRERYDRLLGYWDDYRRAKGARRPTECRLALDNVLDLAPTDLSARRLALRYAGADMREAGRNLFADAQKYDRDGLPDEALRAARRAVAYADDATQVRYADFVTRLERANLPPEQRELLAKAEAAVADGELAQGYRLLTQVRAKVPLNPYLESLETRWHPYALVAALAAAAEQRPDDLQLQTELANAWFAAKAPAGAARVYGRLRRADPTNLKWPLAECLAWSKAGRADRLAAVLRDMRERWPTETAHAQQQYGIKLDPPTIGLSSGRPLGARLVFDLTVKDPSGPARVTAQLDDGLPLAIGAQRVRLDVDLGRVLAGTHKLVVRALDRFDNLATRTLGFEAPALDAGPLLRELPVPKAAGPARVAVSPGPVWQVPAGSRVLLDGGALFTQSGLRKVALPALQAVDQPPFRLDLTAPAGSLDLAPVATLADGANVNGARVRVEATAEPPCWLVSPAPGSTLAGTWPVVVGIAQRPAGAATVALWVDGQVWLRLPAAEPARADLSALPPGAHWFTAVLETAERRWVSPSALVTVEATVEPVTVAAAAGLAVSPTSAIGLARTATVALPAVRVAAQAGALSWRGGLLSSEPGLSVSAGETALRLDGGPTPGRVTVGLGDSLAFAQLPPRTALGFGPRLTPGPLATTVWTPQRAGTYRLSVGEREVVLQVGEQPPVVLTGLVDGSILLGPARLKLWCAAEAVSVTLLDGDRALATWAVPAPACDLDPAALTPGYHVLRAVATTADGARLVSRALVVRSEN